MGRDGLPFNFTWAFSGAAGAIEWGIKESDGDAFTKDGKILSLKGGGQQDFLNSRYDGRVTGYRMSGQVVFAFNAVSRNDVNTYLCILRAASARDSDQYDHIHLIVEGNHGWSLIKTESIWKLSNLNFQWTKTLYQNNLNNIPSFLHFSRAIDIISYIYNVVALGLGWFKVRV